MAPLTDWMLTLWQTLPRVRTVLRHLRPTLHLSDLRDIDAEVIAELRLRAFIWDIDGTVMPSHAPEVHPAFAPAWERLLGDVTLKHAIVSNSGERRFVELGRIFPTIPVLRAYRTDDGVRYRKLLGGVETWSGAAGEGVPARVIKKPDAGLIEYALEELGNPDPQSVLMVGDQYFTDVAGASLAGVRSVKVGTLDRSSFALPVRVFQHAEAVIYRLLHGRPQRRSDHA